MKRGDIVRILDLLHIHEDKERSTQDKVVAPCPFAPFYHSSGKDSKPSFAAFPNTTGKSGFICLSCHQQGTLHSLARNLSELREEDPTEVLAAIAAGESDLEFDYDDFEQMKIRHLEKYTPPPALKWYAGYNDAFDDAYSTPEGRSYLRERGVSKSTAELLQLKYDPVTQRVLFPVFDRSGGFYGFTGRGIFQSIDPKIQDYAGLPKQHVLLGEQLWQDGRSLIIVEGLFAYAHLIELGLHREYNVAALLGSEMTLSKANKIAAYANPVYLLFDNDEAGYTGVYGIGKKPGALHRLHGHVPVCAFVWPEEDMRYTVWPDGKDDPDQLTKEEVLAMIDQCKLMDTIPEMRKAARKKAS